MIYECKLLLLDAHLLFQEGKSGYEMPNRICIELANSIGLTIDPKGNFNPISLDSN